MTDDRSHQQPERPSLPGALVPVGRRPSAVRPSRKSVAMQEPDAGISPRRVLDAIRYWWKWALPAGIALATLASLTVYLLFEPKFEATAWIQIREHAPYIAFEAKGELSNSKAFVATQIELLRSPMVVSPVMLEPEISALPEVQQQDDPVAWLSKHINVKRVGDSELYTVSFACSRPQAAERTVNAIVDSYFIVHNEKQVQHADIVKKLLKTEQDTLEKQVDELRKSVRDMAQRVTGRDPFNGGIEPSADETTPIASLVSQLIARQVDDTVLAARLKVLKAVDMQRTSLVPETMVDAAVAQNPKVEQAASEIAVQRMQLNELLASVSQGKDSQEYKRAVERYTRSQKTLEEFKKELKSQTKAKLETQRIHEYQQAIAELEADAENGRVTRKMLEERYAQEMQKVEQSTGDSVTLKFEQDKLAQKERVLEVIAERIVVLSTEQNAPISVVEYRKAIVPLAPLQSLPFLNLLIAMGAGFLAPFGLAVLKEQLTGRVVDAEHVERNAYLTVLGEITALPSSNRRRRLEHRDSRGMQMFQESIEALRSSILLSDNAESLRILAVASAVNKEGKTSVAVQLAASIAHATQKRVLVIDGDLRDPSVHQVFDIPRMPGLTNVLSGECSLDYAIVATRTELVDVLSAGYLDGNPYRLLEERRWTKLIDGIPPEYRYVIIDTPPVLAASEALVLARSADAVLICAMRDVTRLTQLKKATERILSAGAKVAGMVLSGVPAGQYADRYGSYFFETDH